MPWENGGSGGLNHWPVTYDSRIDQASISAESADLCQNPVGVLLMLIWVWADV